MKQKPRLSTLQIWNMSVGFLGIQMGFALQNANASRILQIFGADVHELSWFWIVAPLTGLIVQPIIGHYSDRTWTKLGRRRPYFLIGAIMAAAGLILMPNSDMFTAFLPALYVGAGMLFIMDASFNIAMEPFRALVADMLPSDQRTLGFSIQTVLIGIGAVIGSWLPYALTNWFNVSNTAVAGAVPLSLLLSFIIGAAVLVTSILITVIGTKEYSPEELAAYSEEKEPVQEESASLLNIFSDFKAMPVTMRQLSMVQFFSWFGLFGMWVFTTPAVTQNKYDMNINPSYLTYALEIYEGYTPNEEDEEKYSENQEKLVHLLEAKEEESVFVEDNLASFVLKTFQVDEKKLSLLIKNEIAQDQDSLSDNNKTIHDVLNEGKITYPVLQFFTQNHDKAKLGLGDLTEVYIELKKVTFNYQEGANWVGIIFGVYNLVSAIFAFFLPAIAKKLGRKRTHEVSLVIGAIGLISIYFAPNEYWLIASMVGIGVAWASILAMPYAILAGSIPSHKMGVYMGIFNFFIVIPQIINALIGGPLVKYLYGNNPVWALVTSGVSFLIAAALVTRVKDVDDEVEEQ